MREAFPAILLALSAVWANVVPDDVAAKSNIVINRSVSLASPPEKILFKCPFQKSSSDIVTYYGPEQADGRRKTLTAESNVLEIVVDGPAAFGTYLCIVKNTLDATTHFSGARLNVLEKKEPSQTSNRPSKLAHANFLKFQEEEDEVEFNIGGGEEDEVVVPTPSPTGLELICGYTGRETEVQYEWTYNGTVVGKDRTLPIDSETSPGRYYCTVYTMTTGEGREGRIKVHTKDSDFNVTISDPKIRMMITEKKYVYYYEGDTKELNCYLKEDADGLPIGDSEKITWTFLGEPIDLNDKENKFTKMGQITREDHQVLSLLQIKNMDINNMGAYVCKGDGFERQIVLILKKRLFSLLTKEVIRVPLNYKRPVEFSCQIVGASDYTEKDIKWVFIPYGTTREEPLPQGVNIEYRQADSLTSFLNIAKVDTMKLDGNFVCKLGGQQNLTRLNVYKVEISPQKIRLQVGARARFMCTATDTENSGKIFWTRGDRRDLGPNEQVIGTETGKSVLILKAVTLEDDNITFTCTYKKASDTALLMVGTVCPIGQRPCTNGKCIDESLWCDGKKDCTDGSDEILEKCNECEPNQILCKNHNGKDPKTKCVLTHWKCDGEDDCANGYDELDCPYKNKDKCLGTHYLCNDNTTYVPRAYWCDGERDCKSGADEEGCSLPQIIYPTPSTSREINTPANATLRLMCNVTGRPLPTITWRYNWYFLHEEMKYNITEIYEDCDRVTSILTIYNVSKHFSGVYTCEAVAKRRVMGPDYFLYITDFANQCKEPYFNDEAYFKEQCLRCYCSEKTNTCKSLYGYSKSPISKKSSIDGNDYSVRYYNSKKTPETVRDVILYMKEKGKYVIKEELYKTITNPNMFMVGSFGLQGSWLLSYGMELKFKAKLGGLSITLIDGPILVLYGETSNLYWCRRPDKLAAHAAEEYYENFIDIRLSEKEYWHRNPDCDSSADRIDMMEVLANVKEVAIRIKYYVNQTDFEMSRLELDYASKTDLSYHWLPMIEKCDCPKGYMGLSCEKCAYGYKRLPDGTCEVMCTCDKCDEAGNCLECPGNRDGPKCRQCKPGYYRPLTAGINEDCTKRCDCPTGGSNLAVSTCYPDSRDPRGYTCKCPPGQTQTEECRQCEDGTDTPDCPRKKKATDCNVDGTLPGGTGRNCRCKPYYSGTNCDTCKPGSYKFKNKCLECFCSNKTTDCTAADNMFFVTVKRSDETSNYMFNFELANRFHYGLYPIKNGGDQIVKDDRSVVIIKTSKVPGPSILLIKLTDKKERDTRKNIYTRLYGGLMTFSLYPTYIKETEITQRQMTPVVEIVSQKFGRIWTVPTYNLVKRRYEVTFMEDFRMGWSEETRRPINRETLLRALMTAQSLALVFTSEEKTYQDIRLTDLSIQITKKMTPNAVSPDLLAPVEVCECPVPNEGLGNSCEGCDDPIYHSTIVVKTGLPDFKCGGCVENCDKCDVGLYNYDFVSDIELSECKTGLTMSPPSQVIEVREGERLEIPCLLRSFRSGAPIHRWVRIDDPNNPKYVPSDRQYIGDDLTRATLVKEKVTKSDQGLYRCEAFNVVSNISVNYYVRVVSEKPRIVIDINEWKSTKVPGEVIITGRFKPADKIDDFNFIWTNVNGTIVDKEFEIVDRRTGSFRVRIKVGAGDRINIRFQVSGTSPDNPYIYVVEDRKVYIISDDDPDYNSLYLDKNSINLQFLEGARIRVVNPKNLRFKAVWTTDTGDVLPPGIRQNGNDLVIFSAGENHRGRYMVKIYDPTTNQLKKTYYVRVGVQPMTPDISVQLNQNRRRLVGVYLPGAEYCPNQVWLLKNRLTQVTFDITNRVKRVGKKNYTIDYDLTPDSQIVFSCLAIREANLTGNISILINSREPMLKIIARYDQSGSPNPTALVCQDMNVVYKSTVKWTFNRGASLYINESNNLATIDFNRMKGGFDPYLHEGNYTCTAENNQTKKSKTVALPQFGSPGTNHPAKINIYVKVNDLLMDGEQTVIVTPGDQFEIISRLYTSPEPKTRMRWKFTEKGGREIDLDAKTADERGLQLITQGTYWTSLRALKFDPSLQEGTYTCIVEDYTGAIVSQFVNIRVDKYNIGVKIRGLTDGQGVTLGTGDTVTLTIVAEDLSTKGVITDGRYIWEFRDANGTLVDVKSLGASVQIKGERVIIQNITIADLTGRGIFVYKERNYTSPVFTFKVGSSHSHVPRLKIVVKYRQLPNGHNIPISMTCKDEHDMDEFKSTVTIQFKDGAQPQYGGSMDNEATVDWSKDKFRIEKHEGDYECVATNAFGQRRLTVHLPTYGNPTELKPRAPWVEIVSPPNVVVKHNGTYKYIQNRAGQPFELICNVYGNPQPEKIRWYAAQPREITDLPSKRETVDFNIPSNLMAYSLKLQSLSRHRSRLVSVSGFGKGLDSYTFICNASNSLGEGTDRMDIKVMDDIFTAKMIDTGNVFDGYKNTGDSIELGCEAVYPSDSSKQFPGITRYEFLFFKKDNYAQLDARDIATTVELDGSTIKLNLLKKNGTILVQCVAFFNDTYDSRSKMKELKIRGQENDARFVPLEITTVNVIKTKPGVREALKAPYQYTLNASQEVEFLCQPVFKYESYTSLSIEWVKCLDEECLEVERDLPGAREDLLSFPRSSTNYKTAGKYICVIEVVGAKGVSIDRKVDLQLKRFGSPQLATVKDIEIQDDGTVDVMCVEKYAEPKSEITWTFQSKSAEAGSPFESLPIEATVEDIDDEVTRGSLLTIEKAKTRPELSGKYKCQAKNAHGIHFIIFNLVITKKGTRPIGPKPLITQLSLVKLQPKDGIVLSINERGNYAYNMDASKPLELECKAEYVGQSIAYYWQKCTAPDCAFSKSLANTSKIFLRSESTKVGDEGYYQCMVRVSIGAVVTQEVVKIELSRIAAPQLPPIGNQAVTEGTAIKIECIDEYSSPAGVLTWSFLPSDADLGTQPGRLPEGAQVVDVIPGRRSVLTIPADKVKPAVSGKYQCNSVNVYGYSFKEFWIRVTGVDSGEPEPPVVRRIWVEGPSVAEAEDDYGIYYVADYMARSTSVYTCKVEFVGNKIAMHWVKCLDYNCFELERIIANDPAKPELLILTANETAAEADGKYMCQVEVLTENFPTVSGEVIFVITRFSGPRIEANAPENVAIGQTLELVCKEKYGFPFGPITWSFMPVTGKEFVPLPSGTTVETEMDGRLSIMSISSRVFAPGYYGSYKCTSENKYGTSYTTFTIGVKPSGTRFIF